MIGQISSDNSLAEPELVPHETRPTMVRSLSETRSRYTPSQALNLNLVGVVIANEAGNL